MSIAAVADLPLPPRTVPLALERAAGVLVVDDEASVRTCLRACLEHAGFSVWTAANGREAIGVYSEYRDRIGVLLLDVHMPDLDGLQTLAQLRTLGASLISFFMSGEPRTYAEETLLRLGALQVLPKPFRVSSLVERLQRLLLQQRE